LFLPDSGAAGEKIMKRTKLIAVIIAGAIGVLAVARKFSARSQGRNAGLSLTFQRYSDLDLGVGEAAFLWLTNGSGDSYWLSPTGGTNTFVVGTTFGLITQSWMVDCEFRDQTANGWTNWTQPHPPNSMYVTLGPRSGLVVRVPLDASGGRRKAAVICRSPPRSLAAFWTSGFGIWLLRMSPASWRSRILMPKLAEERVWCDRELSYPADRFGMKKTGAK
jgi:hypothetical protein